MFWNHLEGELLVNMFGSGLLIELCAASKSFCNLLGLLSLIARDGGWALSPAATTSAGDWGQSSSMLALRFPAREDR